MGVRGLSTFFNQNPQILECYKLHDSYVVIDGNNLMHFLYFTYKLDCIYGGDYFKYSKVIRKYFLPYLDCNIKPIIVFDGGYDTSNRKLKTTKKRSKDRLSLVQHIAKYGRCSGKVLPLLAQEVFIKTLQEMNITYAQCDYEADEQLTALANHYECPVISNDSDFYIYDLSKGFILLDSVEPIVCCDENDDNPYNYIECSIYYIDNFLKHFTGIDKSVLPLFGTLVGNDYVDANVFETFYSNINFPKFKSKKLKVAHNQQRMVRLLAWLKHVNLNEAIDQVLEHLKPEKHDYIRTVINDAIEGYKLRNTNIINVVKEKMNLKCSLTVSSSLKSPCGNLLPDNFVFQFQCGHFPSLFLNIINLHRIFLPAQVENVAFDSSFVCSQFLRQILYGILLRHDIMETECRNELCLKGIEEYDRRQKNMCHKVIDPIFTLDNYGSLPKLNEVNSLGRKESMKILLTVLSIKKLVINLLPKYWQLLFGSIIYWLKNASPKPSEEFLCALIISILYYTFLNASQSKRISFINCQNEESKTSDATLLIANLKETELDIARQNIKKYHVKPAFNNGNPLFVNIIHSYSQLQSCILYAKYINRILNSPLEGFLIHRSCNGTIIYNLTKEIMTRPFPDLFISELLVRGSNLDSLFQCIKCILLENVPEGSVLQTDHSQIRKRKKKKAQGPSKKQCEDDEAMLSNKFLHLNNLTEEENVQ